ncbi:MAG: hypothetical protein KDI10_17175 [Halioglobus sp.]|nr:hypothetical protein [Halioglobus sp.]MCB1710445.1 hypothetical protein [Halioglobus sp.]MCP5123903.1 hypothetical protein [Pseudomonadales bacterium]MCP5192718.1 hypothetical protein [Pseudomonadales bacterium]
MPKLTVKFVASTLAAFALLNSGAALSQDHRWFRVELLVFANQSGGAPAGAATAEQFDPTPTLSYPTASRFLVDPALVEGNRAEFDGESVVDEYGRQIITILTQSPAIAGTATGMPPTGAAGGVTPAPPTPVTQTNPAPAQAPAPLTPVFSDPSLAATAQAATSSTLPRPYVILPRSYQEFAGKADVMQRSGRYPVLFHETWVQPLEPEPSSLPIVLDRSGDSQQWPALQGSVRLYLSRYLHIETNLWLNTAGQYLPGTWRMPAPPFGPPSLIIEEEEVVDMAAAIDGVPGESAPATEATTAVVELAASGDTVTAVAADPAGDAVAGVAVVEAVAPVYPYRHAVLLQQTRRMRSGEVNYIDHPMLGAIIKFTPVTAEQLAAIAQEQATTLPDDAQAL